MGERNSLAYQIHCRTKDHFQMCAECTIAPLSMASARSTVWLPVNSISPPYQFGCYFGPSCKSRSDFLGKPVHLFLDHRVRFAADIEIQNDLVDAGGLDLFQAVDDLRG